MRYFIIPFLSVLVSFAFAQDLYETSREDSVECVTYTSLYYAFFKKRDYSKALKHWRRCARNCPASSQAIYQHGSIMYQWYVKNTRFDTVLSHKYLDTLLSVLDGQIKYFGDEAHLLGVKGVYILEYNETQAERACRFLKQAYELQGINAESHVMEGLIKCAVLRYQQEFDSERKENLKVEIRRLYNELSGVCQTNILKHGNGDARKEDRYRQCAKTLFEIASPYLE